MIRSRHTFLYVALLLLAAGFYYYFEVVGKREKEAARKTERKVFHFQVDQVEAFDILSRDKSPLRVAKDQQWKIIEPIQADVDPAAVNGFLTTLRDLEMERQVAESHADSTIYGLGAPSLQLRFKIGDGWQEIALGDKNPVGDGYYARVAGDGPVFLVATGNYTILNKDVTELRRHQLFIFEPQGVTGLEVTWREGDRLLVRKDHDQSWKSPEHPQTVIKKSKVDHVLDQIQWLRARDFLTDESSGLAGYGLQPALVTVRLERKGERELLLRLGKEEPDRKRVNAVSSELAGVVQIDAGLLRDLPKTLPDLEDRALLGFDSNETKQIFWQLADSQGHLLQAGSNRWMFRNAPGAGTELKEPWRVRSLFWELDDAEYQERLAAAGPPPVRCHGYLELWGKETMLAAFFWENSASAGPGEATVWRSSGSAEPLRAFRVKSELLDRIEEKLNQLSPIGQTPMSERQ